MNHYYLVEGKKRNNLGDVLQGMVASAFLNEDAKPLDRERLNDEFIDKGYLIANGWFMHNYDAFPPNINIVPLYISFHLASVKLLFLKKNRAHFRNFGPVGCRDRRTQLYFLLNGIPAYYSGCLTILFSNLNVEKSGDVLKSIAMVDNIDHPIPSNIYIHLTSLLSDELVRTDHNPLNLDLPFFDYVSANELKVFELFKTYQRSKFIVTNKLHCALPCLSLGLKVIFIHPNPNDPRLDILRRFIPIYSYENVKKWQKIPEFIFNDVIFRRFQTKLDKIVKQFVITGINPMKKINNKFKLIHIYLLAFLLMPVGFILRLYMKNQYGK